MIEQFGGGGSLRKNCKKWTKNARIDMHHLSVHDPCKNWGFLAEFCANQTKGSGDVAKTNFWLLCANFACLQALHLCQCPASQVKRRPKCDRIAPSHPLSWPCVSDLLTMTSKARAGYALKPSMTRLHNEELVN